MANKGRIFGTLAVAAIIMIISAGAVRTSVEPGESIQAAVNAATSGDTIDVPSGVYHENLNISKQIVLHGIGRPLIDSGAIGSAVTLRADGSEVSGFQIRTSRRTGIYVLSSNNTLRNNTISGCMDGIRLDHASHNSVAQNDINNNTNGITLVRSRGNIVNNNLIKDNNIDESSDCGIYLAYSGENILRENDLLRNGDCSISLRSSSSNFLLGNNASHNDWYGIALAESSNGNFLAENNASGNKAAGIYLDSSCRNSLGKNLALSNSAGIQLDYDSNDNLLEGNNVSFNEKGLHLANHSSNNTIRDNTAIKNDYGIYLTFSAGWNLVFANHLVANGYNAYDKGLTNRWDNGSAGNYYSDLGQVFYVPGGPSVDRYPQAEQPAVDPYGR
jgi:nitrous oxidase accessory protein